MKNRFKLFDRVENRGFKALDRTIPDLVESDFGNFVYIPGSFFDRIIEVDGYDYLTGGLFVGEKKLKATPAVRERLDDLIETFGNDNYPMVDDIDWYTSKKIVKRLGGRMMTPSEMVTVYGIARNMEIIDLYEDLILDNEWLDAYCYDWNVWTRVGFGEKIKSVESNRYQNHHGWVYVGDVNLETGFPEQIDDDPAMEMYWRTPEKELYYSVKNDRGPHGLIKSWHNLHHSVDLIPQIKDCKLDRKEILQGVRLCYSMKEMKKMLEVDK